MSLTNRIIDRYFSGISVKLFIIAKLAIAIFILLNMYPNAVLIVNIAGDEINLIPVIVGVIFILIISHTYNKLLAEPLIEINKTVSKIARLDFSTNCPVESNDELGELADNLNLISGKLNSTISSLEMELENKQRLISKNRALTDSLSHEMKTPLGIIKSYSEALKDNLSPEKHDRYLDTIINETDRMNRLVVELLNLSAMETGAIAIELQTFDIVELIEEVAGRILIDTADRNYDVLCDFPDEAVNIKADRAKIEQVLSNFISNAGKHVSDNGSIRLTVTGIEDKIAVEVYNDGDTIPEARLPYIWDKFYRIDPSRDKKTGGTGLGLATAAQILKMHNYNYGVRNKDKGVCFYFNTGLLNHN